MYGDQKMPVAAGALDGTHAYRLKEWPEIPERFRTARVLGACSRMSLGPVTANWFLNQTGLAPARASELMCRLIAQGAIDCLELGCAIGQPVPDEAPASGRPPRPSLAQRFAWKHAAAALIVCLGATAAIDADWRAGTGPVAVPHLPSLAG